MRVYFYSDDNGSPELLQLQKQIKSKLPELEAIASTGQLTQALAPTQGGEPTIIIFPILGADASLDRVLSVAEKGHRGVFFIFVSSEISASDYKRLVRGGNADWASLQDAPQEILDIISRADWRRNLESGATRPTIVTFFASGGGVGNATLAIETAVQIKLNKKTRECRVCLLDLDFQSSHVCDYLDIEPRLQMGEIVRDPIRLDSQLFDLFVSRHPTSGVEVLASPRQRDASTELTIPPLDALFGFISQRYDVVIIDLPERHQEWTSLILSICDLVIITGLNNVPGLRRIGESMKFINTAARSPPQIALVLNRCETDLFGRPRHSQHVNRFLGQNKVLFVREDPTAATESVNTGIPVSIANSSSKIAKDVRAVASLVTAAWTGQGRLSEPLKLTFFRGEKVTPNRD